MKDSNLTYEKVIELKNKVQELIIETRLPHDRVEQEAKVQLIQYVKGLKKTLRENLSLSTSITQDEAIQISDWTSNEENLEFKSAQQIEKNAKEIGGVLLKNNQDIIGYGSAQKYKYFDHDVFEFGTLYINQDRRNAGLSSMLQGYYIQKHLKYMPHYLLTKSFKVNINSYRLGLERLSQQEVDKSKLKKVMELGGNIDGYTIFVNQKLLDLFISLESNDDLT